MLAKMEYFYGVQIITKLAETIMHVFTDNNIFLLLLTKYECVFKTFGRHLFSNFLSLIIIYR